MTDMVCLIVLQVTLPVNLERESDTRMGALL